MLTRIAAFVLLLCPMALADANQINYVEKTLSNGLRVVTHEDFSCPVVAVQVWYHVGSKDENPERQGFAHMFEHMMFRGTDRFGPKTHFELIRKVGGDTNAYTSFDNTTYVQKLPSNQLELALYLESERMAFLKIDDDSFFTERAVVEEERRLGMNAPYGTAAEKILKNVFTKHPYRWTPIGQIPHLRAATIDELNKFWETYYVPNNAVLVIVGAVKHDDAQKLAEKYFAWIPKGETPPRVTEMEPMQTQAREFTIPEPKGPVTIVGIGYRGPKQSDADSIAVDVMTRILGGGESSWLYQEMVKNKETAVAAGAAAFGLEQDGVVGAFAVVKPFGDKKACFEQLSEQVERVKSTPVTEDELKKVKTELLKGQVDSAQTVEAKAQLLGSYAVLFNDLPRLNKRFAEIEAVTVEDVQRVAKKYLVKEHENRVTIEQSFGELLKSLVGKGVDEGAAASTKPTTNRIAERIGPKAQAQRPADFPTTAPIAALMTEFPKPATEEKTLANGLKVVVVPDKELPLVSMTLGLKFGAFSDDPAKLGAASMSAQLITQGTENYDALKLATELESNAVSLGGGVGMDTGTVSASCLTEQSDRAMRLLAEVVRRPTFPQKDFEQLRKQMLSGLSISEQSPEYLADKELRKQVWGNHPYARIASGEAADVRKLAPEDLKAWWNAYVRPDTCVLYIAGDLAPAEAISLAERYLGDWKAEGATPTISIPSAPQKVGTHIYLIDKPGVQSQIRVGHTGITRDNSDYQAARITTQIFGGAFNSRLNESLRVKKGLTYGAGGGFRADRFAGNFTLSTFSKTPSTAEAVKTILDEIKILQDGSVTEQELGDSKTFIVGSFAGQRETPSATVGDLWLIEYSNLPKDYLQSSLNEVGKTTESDVQRVAKNQIDPMSLTIVVVGDAKQIKDDLGKIAPLTLIDPKTAATQPAK